MKAFDFEYDGLNLSNIGFTICNFGEDGLQTITNGSQIAFHTVSTGNGSKHEFLSSQYDSCLEASFQICKNPCVYDDLEITSEELRYVMKWLNRKEFHKFKLLEESYMELYFEASFNVSRIEIDGKVYGFELNLFTNRPFALQEPKTIIIKNSESDGYKSITNISDEIGYIYPEHMEILIQGSGDLSIYNALDDRTTYIRNCVSGEILTFRYPVIESSVPSHDIANDFNWNFFRIANTFKTGKNNLTISLPCTITIKYSPVIKIGI